MSALKLDETAADSLQMKLNLKKQIWTGAWNESTIDRTRPLSWGHAAATTIKTTSQYLEVREYDSEQLLIACSKKLAAWQESGTHQQGKQQQQHHQGRHQQKNKQSMGNERRLNRDGGGGGKGRLQKGFHVSTASFINRCNITRITELGKTKKLPQSYALAKIVEATDFINGKGGKPLATKGGGQTSIASGQKKKNSLTSPQLPTTTTTQSNGQGTRSRTSHHHLSLKKKPKFKTGGIVVTAVQNHPGATAPKRIRSILPGHMPDPQDDPGIPSRDSSGIKKRMKIRIRKKSKS